MKRLLCLVLLGAVLSTLDGCALMSDEDRDFYGRGWVNPKELDQPFPKHSAAPLSKPTSAPTATSNGSEPLTTDDPNHDPAWDVPGGPPR